MKATRVFTLVMFVLLAFSQAQAANAQQGPPPALNRIPVTIPDVAHQSQTVGPTNEAAATWKFSYSRAVVGEPTSCSPSSKSPQHSDMCVFVSYTSTEAVDSTSTDVSVFTQLHKQSRVKRQAFDTYNSGGQGCPVTGCFPGQPSQTEWNCTWLTKYDYISFITDYTVGECAWVTYTWYTSWMLGQVQYNICQNLYNSGLARAVCESPQNQNHFWNPQPCTWLYIPWAVWVCGAESIAQTEVVDEQICYGLACTNVAQDKINSVLLTYPKNGHFDGSNKYAMQQI